MVATDSLDWTLACRRGLRLLGNHDGELFCSFSKLLLQSRLRIDAFDRRVAAIRHSKLDVADLRFVILDQVNKRRLAVMLNLEVGINVTPSSVFTSSFVFTNCWEQSVVFVIEARPHFDRAGGGIDLIVERQQLSAGDLGLLRSIEASTVSFFLSRVCACTCARLSSAMVKSQ